jgi:hypothetical protein
MTKQSAIDILREAIRQLRIERDNGDDAAHDQVLKLTTLLLKLGKLPSKQALELASQYGIE